MDLPSSVATLVGITLAAGCASRGESRAAEPTAAAAVERPRAVADDWTHRFDLDGDGARDEIEVTFTGGAHCCYRLAVALASGRRFDLPFELDGGYVGGLDLGQPDQLAVADDDGDGLPDLLMRIQTYGCDVDPIPPAWTSRYGIRGNTVAVGFRGGRIQARDRAAPPPCRD